MKEQMENGRIHCQRMIVEQQIQGRQKDTCVCYGYDYDRNLRCNLLHGGLVFFNVSCKNKYNNGLHIPISKIGNRLQMRAP